MIDLNSIKEKLNKLGIFIDESTFQLHHEQGAVNEVYAVNSNKGKLIIHLAKHSERNVQLNKARRIFGLSSFLKKHPKVPTTEVITYGTDSNGNVFVVQKFIEGKRLNLAKDKLKHLKRIAEILIYIHQIDIEGGGHITFRTNKIKGSHKDWFNFLRKESYKSLKDIYKAEKYFSSKKEYLELKIKLMAFFKKYKNYFENVKGKLIHGDIQLDNIIAEGNEISAFIDLEWSCAGDPAWEFTKAGGEDILKEYFKEMKKLNLDIDEDDFRFRIELYWIIKLLFIAETFKKYKEKLDWYMEQSEKRLNKLL